MNIRIRLHTDTDPTGRVFLDLDDEALAASTVTHLLAQPTVTMMTVEKDDSDNPLASYRWDPCTCSFAGCSLGTLTDPRGRIVDYGNTLHASVRALTVPSHGCSPAEVRV